MILFARNGFKGTTTREIAGAVGVSEPVLYQHFATKRDLYTAIVDQMVAEAGREFDAAFSQLDPASDAVTFFTWVGNAVIDWYSNHNEHIRLLLFSALEGHDLAEMWHEKATTPFLSVVEQGIISRQDKGFLRGVDAMVAARGFIGMVAHYGLSTTLFGTSVPGLSYRQAVDQFVELYLSGFRPRLQEGLR